MGLVIGLDYGTQAARAVLADAETGQVLCSHRVRYPHGVMEGNLASADDYESVLYQLLEAVTPEKYRRYVEGICVDATSLTMVPLTAEGKVLSQLPELKDRHHAQIKLWKYHRAQALADEALSLARTLGERFLGRTGGTISCEWTLPKLLEIRDEDPKAYAKIDTVLDLCEFLTYRLTNKLTRSVGSMCFKGLWAQDIGFPSDAFLDGLRPGFSKEYRHMMRGQVIRTGERAGSLRPELCQKLGFREDVAVAAGTLDGHTAIVALGALQARDAALVIGTSNVLTIQTQQLYEIEGICGIALDGLTPGLYGIDSGQSCTGDMLEWFIQNALPAKILQEAEARGVSPHDILTEQIRRPWENTVIAADWWNGSRNAPCNLNLRGIISGLSLATQPQDIYLALLQSIVCGTREIIEQCESYGIVINRVLATGGIAGKNPLLMKEYANFLDCPVYVGQENEGPAMGSAIFAAVAAGIYSTPFEAYEHMGVHEFICYEPDKEHRNAYEELYQKNHMMRILAGKI